MTERRQLVSGAYMRISYPEFSDEGSKDGTERMNAFYKSLADASSAYAEELNREREGGLRILTAEYRTMFTVTGCVVEYKITVRRRGRVIGKKSLVHHWENGVLVPERMGDRRIHRMAEGIKRLLTKSGR